MSLLKDHADHFLGHDAEGIPNKQWDLPLLNSICLQHGYTNQNTSGTVVEIIIEMPIKVLPHPLNSQDLTLSVISVDP
jgi:hypothetical protein